MADSTHVVAQDHDDRLVGVFGNDDCATIIHCGTAPDVLDSHGISGATLLAVGMIFGLASAHVLDAGDGVEEVEAIGEVVELEADGVAIGDSEGVILIFIFDGKVTIIFSVEGQIGFIDISDAQVEVVMFFILVRDEPATSRHRVHAVIHLLKFALKEVVSHNAKKAIFDVGQGHID